MASLAGERPAGLAGLDLALTPRELLAGLICAQNNLDFFNDEVVFNDEFAPIPEVAIRIS